MYHQCLLCLSVTMGVVYAIFVFTEGSDLACAANQVDYYPLNYNDQKELDAYL